MASATLAVTGSYPHFTSCGALPSRKISDISLTNLRRRDNCVPGLCLDQPRRTVMALKSRRSSGSPQPRSRGGRIRWQCRASWFEFSSESSSKSGGNVTTGDFTILSHLKELGCGELTRRPREVHFSGCINESYAFHSTGGDFFVKINRTLDMDSLFVGESEALRMLEATKTIVVPSPLGCGNLPDGGSYIIMSYLRFRPFGMMQSSSQMALGQNLARLHQAECDKLFGFPIETRVGVVSLDNRWNASWSEFFIEQRLKDRLQKVYDKLGDQKADLEEKGSKLLIRAKEILEDHTPKPSVLHGDLWMGNSGLLATGEVAIFDPASFIGDAEFDLAFEGWTPVQDFPGFSSDFYTAYHDVLPKAAGFEERHRLYQLFHLLNHYVICMGDLYFLQVLPSMFVVKAYAAEAFEMRRFEKLALADCQAQLGKKRMKAFIPEVITAVYAATAVVLFGVGTWVISQGKFDGAGMVAFVTSLVLLIEPIQAMGKAYNELKQGEPAIERLFELTNFKSKVLEGESTTADKKLAGEVEFCNVSYQYQVTSPWVLKDISLKVRPGETVALVGPSGGGKTTLAKLLLRLYDPIQGCIQIDGHDIRDLGIKSLRQQVTIVPQETTLFTGTVAENIAYGDSRDALDMKKIERAARLANAEEFIKKLPNGYNSHLGDRASSLSGGQRQRLAIARAIYQDASILILDEATSALDNKSEELVREALEALMVGHTVFVIAHRLETVQRADRILLLDGGKLVEEGTHSSLLSKGGQYASLYTREYSSLLQPTAS